MPEESVADFCAALREMCRASRRSVAGLAKEVNVSRGHLHAILKGDIRRPPDFSRLVEPLVRACGGDDRAVAQWRERHRELEHTYEQQERLRRSGPVTAGPAPAEDATEPSADQPPVQPVQPSPGPGSPVPGGYEYAHSRRRWLLLAGAGALVVVLSIGAGIVSANLAGSDAAAPTPTPGAASPTTPTSSIIADGVSGAQLCPLPAPAEGQSLLDALPDFEQTRNGKHRQWWGNSGRVRFRALSTTGFEVSVDAVDSRRADAIVIRSCIPISVDHKYRLSFTAGADRPVTVRVRVQENIDPLYTASLDRHIEIGPQPQEFTWDFTGVVSYPANEVIFQVGGNPDHRLTVSDLALVQTSAD